MPHVPNRSPPAPWPLPPVRPHRGLPWALPQHPRRLRVLSLPLPPQATPAPSPPPPAGTWLVGSGLGAHRRFSTWPPEGASAPHIPSCSRAAPPSVGRGKPLLPQFGPCNAERTPLSTSGVCSCHFLGSCRRAGALRVRVSPAAPPHRLRLQPRPVMGLPNTQHRLPSVRLPKASIQGRRLRNGLGYGGHEAP